jgi:hypothetical protein
MTRIYSIRLLERVIATGVIAFLATFVAVAVATPVTSTGTLNAVALGDRGLVAGVAAIIQLVLSALVAPHVGDPASPELVPRKVLRKLGQQNG